MAINGNVVYLRAMELSDMEAYREMINDETISSSVVGWSFPVSIQQQENWYKAVNGDPSNIRLSIILKDTEKIVGMVTLSNIDWHNRSATHGIKLMPSCPKKKGIGTDAVLTLMEYAFNEVNLNRLDGSWLAKNFASKELYTKCGWKEEGVKKEAVFKNGKYQDLVIAGITKSDYLKMKRNDYK